MLVINKPLVVLSLLLILSQNCHSKKEKRDSETHLAYSALKFIYEGDTNNLKTIIDTAYCYTVYTSEGFWHKVKFVSDHMKECNQDLDFNKIEKNIKRDGYSLEYNFILCQNSLDSSKRFKLNIQFDMSKPNPRNIMFVGFELMPATIKDLEKPPGL